jgi:hypothetical protein
MQIGLKIVLPNAMPTFDDDEENRRINLVIDEENEESSIIIKPPSANSFADSFQSN